MNSLQYLTVQDVLWINLQITKKVQHYNYARLEEATFYQYAYGESNSLIPQAGRFLYGFPKLHPFDAGNEATGFVAVMAFLKLNGIELSLDDASGVEWHRSNRSRQSVATAALEAIAKTHSDDGHHGHPNVRSAIRSVLDEFPNTVRALTENPIPVG